MGWLVLFVVILCFPVSTSQDSLVPGISIRANSTLVSFSKIFALGFFSTGNSSKHFLGIWYVTYPKSTTQVIWVANRESPLHSPGVCLLGDDGNIVVLDNTRKIIWSTNASISASAKGNTIASLQDTGNLVLTYGKQTLWESFNFPTDTMVPGMKIGFNKRTGQQWRFTSWAAFDDPRPGKFTVGIGPNQPSQLLMWKENVPYWSGAFHVDSRGGPGGEFYNTDNKTKSFLFFAYNNLDGEAFYTCGVSDPSVKMMIVLKAYGVVLLQLWVEEKKTWYPAWAEPINTCAFINRCGPNGACDKLDSVSPCKCLKGFTPKIQKQWDAGKWEGGCIREKSLTCNDHEESFIKFKKLKQPDHVVMLNKGSISECEAECSRNCSCTAYAYIDVLQDPAERCFNWFGELMDLVEDYTYGQELYIRMHQQHSYQADGFVKEPLTIALASSAAGFLALIFGCILWKRTLSKEGSVGGSKNRTIGDFSTKGDKNDTELPLFDLRCVLAATNNFSEANKLGEGGFGPVYKGIFPENQEVAIKRLSKKSGQGHQEFINEIKLIAKLQHKNLVRLLGCCVDDEEMILIYEFMPNRSLDKFLFDPSERKKLDWDKRFRIIEGIAQGVLYIYKHSRLKIIHRDLKASNVLLDEEMNPKISDFGMARIFGVNQTEEKTNRVVGTYGYMSPEYARYGHFSEKSDVFSFGVLLLEIALKLWKEGRGIEAVDASMGITSQTHEALKCLQVGFLCVQEAPADRPTMSTVIIMLQGNEVTLPTSKEPAFSMHSKHFGSSQISSFLSNNALTISIPTAR